MLGRSMPSTNERDESRRATAPFSIGAMQRDHAPSLERLQEIVFPTLSDSERFKAAHYRRHLEIFPEGQFVAIDDATGNVIGATTTLRLDFDFDHVTHTFADVIAGGWLSSHSPQGRWLYGADIGVHPDHRGRGIAKALYAARAALAADLALEGQVTVGMLSGYGAVKHEVSLGSYFDDVIAGRRRDPTVSFQLALGFTPRGLLPRYLDDPVCDGAGVLLVLPTTRVAARSIPGIR